MDILFYGFLFEIRPLDRAILPLDPLPSLDFESRRDDPFRDRLLAPLLSGELGR